MPRDISKVGLHTDAPAAAGEATAHGLKVPEFLAMPTIKGVEPFSQLKRGKINQLVLPCARNNYRPPVKSITLRPPGAARGTRLVVAEGSFPGNQFGLLTYLRKLMAEQALHDEEPSKAAPVLQNT